MPGEARQRIDKWLFFARVVKSRSLAAKLVQAGRVRINRDKASQAADPVKPGDVLTIALDRRIVVFRVCAPGIRRGPAEEARTLYEDLSPPPAPKAARRPTRRCRCARPAAAVRPRGSGATWRNFATATDGLRTIAAAALVVELSSATGAGGRNGRLAIPWQSRYPTAKTI